MPSIKKAILHFTKNGSVIVLAGQAGFEPTTFGFGDRRSTTELLAHKPANLYYAQAKELVPKPAFWADK